MRTSRRPRSIHKSQTSTSDRSTTRLTPGRVKTRNLTIGSGRPRWAAVLLFLAVPVLLGGCQDRNESPHVDAGATQAAVAVPGVPRTPSPDLEAQIDTRADLPALDPIDLAVRYRKAERAVPTARPFAGEPEVGSSREFSILRLTGAAISHDNPPEVVTISADLMVTSAHAYFYTDDAIDADEDEVQEAAEKFEVDVWPLVTGVFGEPVSPGVDGDPRIVVLQADLGGGVGGYVNGDDGYVNELYPLSNEAEIVYLDRTLRPGGELFSSVLAHELQHLIHQRNDRDEEAWVNEGLSEAAFVLTGSVSAGVRRFEPAPQTQLNDWPAQGTGPHYGAGAAFLLYVADRVEETCRSAASHARLRTGRQASTNSSLMWNPPSVSGMLSPIG